MRFSRRFFGPFFGEGLRSLKHSPPLTRTLSRGTEMKDLKKTLDLELAKAMKTIDSCDWSNKNFYADYMAQTFYYVRHSTRLLALAASRLSYEEEQNFHLRFIAHLREESNHEKLALNDLKYLGFKKEDFPEHSCTRLFYEPQYYKIEHQRPLALMGYILFLEALAQKACPKLVETLAETYGNRCATFFHVHGEEDPAHVEAALKVVSELSAEDEKAVIENLSQTSYAYHCLLEEIKANQNIHRLKKAA